MKISQTDQSWCIILCTDVGWGTGTWRQGI